MSLRSGQNKVAVIAGRKSKVTVLTGGRNARLHSSFTCGSSTVLCY